MPTNATISVPIPSGAMPNEQPELHTQGVALGPFICDILICITLGEISLIFRLLFFQLNVTFYRKMGIFWMPSHETYKLYKGFTCTGFAYRLFRKCSSHYECWQPKVCIGRNSPQIPFLLLPPYTFSHPLCDNKSSVACITFHV